MSCIKIHAVKPENWVLPVTTKIKLSKELLKIRKINL